MIGGPINGESLPLYGSFTSSSSYKPMLYLTLAGLPFSFRTVNLKIGVQNTPEYLAINRVGSRAVAAAPRTDHPAVKRHPRYAGAAVITFDHPVGTGGIDPQIVVVAVRRLD